MNAVKIGNINNVIFFFKVSNSDKNTGDKNKKIRMINL